MNCILCNQKLTDKTSIARGMGPDCAAAYALYLATCDATEAEIVGLLNHPDAQVRRKARTSLRYLGDGDSSRAKYFLERARLAKQLADDQQALGDDVPMLVDFRSDRLAEHHERMAA